MVRSAIRAHRRRRRAKIGDGAALVEHGLTHGRAGPYFIQAAIAALHCEAENADETDRQQIAGLYALLTRLQPSPVIELNRAVAIAMASGPERGLELTDALREDDLMRTDPFFHSARADRPPTARTCARGRRGLSRGTRVHAKPRRPRVLGDAARRGRGIAAPTGYRGAGASATDLRSSSSQSATARHISNASSMRSGAVPMRCAAARSRGEIRSYVCPNGSFFQSGF